MPSLVILTEVTTISGVLGGAPPKTPEIVVTSVKMTKDGITHSILENFTPTTFLLEALESAYPTEKFAVSV